MRRIEPIPTPDMFKRKSTDVMFAPSGRDIIVRTPKVGQTSIARTLGGAAQVPFSSLHLYDSVIIFVRDPLERFESTFNYFHRMPDNWPSAWEHKGSRYIQHKPKDVEAFTDLVLAGWLDKHWVPQNWLWEEIPNPVYHRFEDFGKVLNDMGINIRHENSSGVARSGLNYRVPELEALFQGDLAIRESLCQ